MLPYENALTMNEGATDADFLILKVHLQQMFYDVCRSFNLTDGKNCFKVTVPRKGRIQNVISEIVSSQYESSIVNARSVPEKTFEEKRTSI